MFPITYKPVNWFAMGTLVDNGLKMSVEEYLEAVPRIAICTR